MIDLSTVAKKPHPKIQLNKPFHSDLWWDTFLEDWNRACLCQPLPHPSLRCPDVGCRRKLGLWCLHLYWKVAPAGVAGVVKAVHITAKELAPIVVVCALWELAWKGNTVCCQCNNTAVVAILHSSSSKHPLVIFVRGILSVISSGGACPQDT